MGDRSDSDSFAHTCRNIYAQTQTHTHTVKRESAIAKIIGGKAECKKENVNIWKNRVKSRNREKGKEREAERERKRDRLNKFFPSFISLSL